MPTKWKDLVRIQILWWGSMGKHIESHDPHNHPSHDVAMTLCCQSSVIFEELRKVGFDLRAFGFMDNCSKLRKTAQRHQQQCCTIATTYPSHFSSSVGPLFLSCDTNSTTWNSSCHHFLPERCSVLEKSLGNLQQPGPPAPQTIWCMTCMQQPPRALLG